MTTIEERVVAMKFQGEQFLAGIDKSLTKLDQLNNKLKMSEGTKGFDGVGAAAQRQSGALSRIAEGVQHISDRFKTMGVVGMAALSTLASQAIFTGENLVKSLTLGPIIDGFHEYETNLNSIQTILSNTQASGTKLKDVTNALDELNRYSDQTIYNFGQMAKNIGTFTAAGVGLKPAVDAIKGIANLAALSGSNSEQASGAMYQLSQAISSGRVSLEDWNSVVNAGMGGTVFQRALAQNAEKIGTLSKGAVKLQGDMKNVTIEGKSFRESITAKPGKESWLTSKVLTQTLAQFTGDLSDATLKAQGFNDAEIKAIQSQAKLAKNAATQVKTLTQLLGTVKESVGSGWTQTWQTIFGDFPEAQKLFTNANNVLGTYVAASADARNKVLGDWKALGGRTAIINSIANTFKALGSVTKPIRDAFREIFPATTGRQLAEISKSIENFTKNLAIGGTTANNLKRTFAGFFAVLDIGWQIIKQVVSTIVDLLGIATQGSGGFLNFTGNIGDFLVSLDKVIKSGDGLKKVFGAIGTVLAAPIRLIKFLASLIGSLFSHLDGSTAAAAVGKLEAAFKPFGKLGSLISSAWGKVVGVLDNIGAKFASIGGAIGPLGKKIASAFSGLNLDDVFKGVASGGILGIFITLRKALSGGGGGLGGLLDGVKESLDQFTGTLKAMQGTLKAATLLQIAAAIGILAVSMNVLSKIDAGGLARASAAITVMFAQLLGSMALFEKASGFAGAAKLAILAPSLILLSVAINILASAVKKLSGLSWNELAKGLSGVTGLLGAVIATVQLMPNPAGMITTAAGIVILAAGIKILVSAVTDLSGLSWEDMAKGLTGVGALLTALTLFTKFSEADAGGIAQGAGLLLLAVGIKILASAVTDLAKLSWSEIAKGLITLAGSLAIITTALTIIPPTAALSAAGVLVIALSLGKIAAALQVMGSMSWGEIGKGLTEMLGALTIIAAALLVIPPTAALSAAGILIVALSLNQIGIFLQQMSQMSWSEIGKAMVVLAGSLGIIAIALNLMTTALPGAAALLVVAASLAILAPILQLFGNMSWEEMGKGLLMLAGIFAVLGVAGALLTPVIPTLLGLGASIALIGAGVALAGAGIFLLAAGLTVLAVAGAAGTAALVALVAGVLGLIPSIVKILGAALIALIQVIADAAPALLVAAVKIFTTLLTAIDILAPKIISTVFKLLTALVNAFANYLPKLQQRGIDLLVALLNGIAKNIGRVVTSATDVIVAFLNAIGKNAPRITDAGIKMIISFINGLAKAVRNNTAAMQAAGRNLALAIIDGMTGGLGSGVGRIVSKAKEIASSALNAAKRVLGINSPSKEFEKLGNYVNDGFRKGLDGNKGQIDSAFKSLATQISSLYRGASDDVEKLTKKLHKLQDARHEDKKAIKETKAALAEAKKERNEAASVQKYMKSLNDEHSALGRLATQYDTVTAKLKTAKEVYADAVKTRDDYNTQIRDEFSNAPSPTGDVTATDFVKNLHKQVEDTKSFANQLQQLRKLGLNDETYKDLLAAGISALPFVTDLLHGGKSQIDEVNSLNKELDSLATSMGKTASNTLYQAAVDSAAGLVKGLENQQAAIEKQMDKIADAMVKAIKKKLGIKSPSKVFAEVGAFSAQGLSEGLQDKAAMVADSASAIGDKAVEAMRVSLSNVDKMVMGNIDIQPTIRPVLDLTDIQKNASKLGSLLPTNSTMSVNASFSKATDVANAVQARVNASVTTDNAGNSPVLSYTQINNSPKALSSVEIYRGTKNQLSTVKGALST